MGAGCVMVRVMMVSGGGHEVVRIQVPDMEVSGRGARLLLLLLLLAHHDRRLGMRAVHAVLPHVLIIRLMVVVLVAGAAVTASMVTAADLVTVTALLGDGLRAARAFADITAGHAVPTQAASDLVACNLLLLVLVIVVHVQLFVLVIPVAVLLVR